MPASKNWPMDRRTRFFCGYNVIDACAGQDMWKVKGSNLCRSDFVTFRKGDDDAGSHWGDVDTVFCIAQKMTGAAGVGDGRGRGGRGDDVVEVKSTH